MRPADLPSELYQLLSDLKCLAGLPADCVISRPVVVEHEGIQLKDIDFAVENRWIARTKRRASRRGGVEASDHS